jgi:hypothetical protein
LWRCNSAEVASAEIIERLLQYPSVLSPQARAMLTGAFERSLLGGDETADADLVLQQLRAIVREQRERVPSVGHCARMFFKPFEPFLVDDRAGHGFRQSQVDAAVRFCAKVFGGEYAALLTKASAVSAGTGYEAARAG